VQVSGSLRGRRCTALARATRIARFAPIAAGQPHDHGTFACVLAAELPR
jgi:hypothetical protein